MGTSLPSVFEGISVIVWLEQNRIANYFEQSKTVNGVCEKELSSI
jgi:hypothetical protein